VSDASIVKLITPAAAAKQLRDNITD
jgi:hypothetical protein